MQNLKDLTTAQLQRIIDIKQQIEDLESQLDSIAGGSGNGVPSSFAAKVRRKNKMSRAGRAAIAAAARARWAKLRGKKADKPVKKRKKFSAAARKKMAAVAKARWARAKAAGRRRSEGGLHLP